MTKFPHKNLYTYDRYLIPPITYFYTEMHNRHESRELWDFVYDEDELFSKRPGKLIVMLPQQNSFYSVLL